MGFDTVTELKCSNPEILASGSTFNIDNGHFIGIKNGVSNYFCRKYYFLDTVEQLSKTHPYETFTGATWRTDDMESCFDLITVYKNGEKIDGDIKPHYNFMQPAIYNSEDDFITLSPMIVEHLLKYFLRLDKRNESAKDIESLMDILNDETDENGFYSYYCIIIENEEYSFYATRRWVSWIIINYIKKDGSTEHEVSNKLKYEIFDGELREIDGDQAKFSWPENLQKEVKGNLISHINKYINRLIDDGINNKSDSIIHAEDDNGFISYPTFYYENMDHRFVITWKQNNSIEIHYISKDKENIEKLRKENKSLNETIDILQEKLWGNNSRDLDF